jgi:hypothetical protein
MPASSRPCVRPAWTGSPRGGHRLIQQLAAAGGPLRLSLFDQRDMAEITSPDFPGERLVVCKNPLLAAEHARKRGELLAATETDLARIQKRVQRAKTSLQGAAEIGKAVGAVLGKRKMAKHFQTEITDHGFSFSRKAEVIREEARLDGLYVIRTNLPAEQADTAGTVRSYKSLARVERAFRCMKTVELALRPVFHWTAPRVRAHALLCMLAYYLEWRMRQTLASLLFDDHDRPAAEAQRISPVAKAEPSPAAKRKAASKRTEPVATATLPLHSFRTLLSDLATLTRNVVGFGGRTLSVVTTVPTDLQRTALRV